MPFNMTTTARIARVMSSNLKLVLTTLYEFFFVSPVSMSLTQTEKICYLYENMNIHIIFLQTQAYVLMFVGRQIINNSMRILEFI